jgi:predicted metal-binding membrane protein
MDAMPMSGCGTMPMAWMPLCGQSGMAAAASFLGMWAAMMAAMMLPSLVPALWRYRRALGGTGRLPSALPTALVACGYFLVWTLLGAAVYPLGVAVMAAVTRWPALAGAVPLAIGLVVLFAGTLQLTGWKARHLACCRDLGCEEPLRREQGARTPAFGSLCLGLRLGLHCSQACAGLTAILLVTGMMNPTVMALVTGAVTLERLLPSGERFARWIGACAIGAGALLTLQAIALG